jgi:hypothetical protein
MVTGNSMAGFMVVGGNRLIRNTEARSTLMMNQSMSLI